MRFAIVGSRGYPSYYGGFETLVRRLAPFLVRAGHSVVVYKHGSFSAPSCRLVDGVEVWSLPGVGTKRLATLSHGLSAVLHARSESLDGILVLNVAHGFFLKSLARRGTPTVVNVDGLEWERAKWGPLGKAVFRRGAVLCAANAGSLVADSRAVAEVWRAKFGVRCAFIPYGADVVYPGADKLGTLGVSPNAYHLYVARLVPENSIELYLEAVSRVNDGRKVVIVGGVAGWKKMLRVLSELGRDPRYVLLGHLSDDVLLYQLWANSATYFHGHTVGGTNPSLVQAMACGAPIVAINTPFNREVLGCDDFLVEANAPAIADALVATSSAPMLANQKIIHARQRVQGEYTWDSVCSSYETLLSNPCAARRGGPACA